MASHCLKYPDQHENQEFAIKYLPKKILKQSMIMMMYLSGPKNFSRESRVSTADTFERAKL